MNDFTSNIIPSKKFTFNGKFLGDYSQYLNVTPPKNDETVVTEVKVMIGEKIFDVKIAIEKYRSFELIVSELMEEFELPAINYGIIEVNKTKYLIRRFLNEQKFSEAYPDFSFEKSPLSKNRLNNIRQLLALQWVFGLNEMSEDKIVFQIVARKDENHPEYPYDSVLPNLHRVGNYNLNDSKYPKGYNRILNDWFGNNEDLFNAYILNMISNKNLGMLKLRIADVIRKIDDNHIQWALIPYQRLSIINLLK